MFWMEATRMKGKNKLVLYGRHERRIIDAPQKPYTWVRGRIGTMKDAREHKKVQKRVFETPEKLKDFLYWNKSSCFEGDLDYENQIMLDEDLKIGDVPKCWLDIELDMESGSPDVMKNEINAIGMIFDDGREIFLTTIGKKNYTEKMMLDDCMALLQDVGCLMTFNGGSDVWEERSFDLPYLAMRYGLLHGKPRETARFQFDYKMRHCAFLDIYQIYKSEVGKAGKSLAGGFSLESISQHEFGEGKIVHTKSFAEMSHDEMKAYNMRDVELLKRVDEKYKFSDAQIELARMVNLRLTGWVNNKKKKTMTASPVVDNLILGYSRRNGYVWNNVEYTEIESAVKGATVLEPQMGLHKNVQNYDVKQMYPNIMVHERISPDKDRRIIPEIIVKLQKQREELKAKYEKSGDTADWIRQYNCKVLANSIYGLFNHHYNRYHDSDLAEQITAKGRELLQSAKKVCEDRGLECVYGDTDSLFIKLNKKRVKDVENIINRQLKPYEVEAGEHYDSILFLGKASGGVKKRYAGLIDGEMKIVGLEAIRRDYCLLARKQQKHSLRKILDGRPLAEVREDLKRVYNEMIEHKHDADLVISKGCKALEAYSTDRKQLPHVRALKKYIEMGHKQGFTIEFVHTKEDVYPVIEGKIPSDVDYTWYHTRQVLGVVNPLLKSVELQRQQEHNLLSFCSS